MPLPAQSSLGWQVAISILHVAAISSTLVRLVHRWKRACLWWDDWATILPLVFDLLYIAIMWLTIQNKFTGSLFVSFWFSNILFLTIVWISRASLALSIARIFPPKHRCRRIALSLCTLFVVNWIMIVLMGSLECYDSKVAEWWNASPILCAAKRPSVKAGLYLVVAFDFIADFSLAIVPLVMLWGAKLPSHQRRLVFTLFLCSILSLMTSIYFATLASVPRRDLGPDARLLLQMGARLLAGVSILICNIMVLATLAYRVRKANATPEDSPVPEGENNAPEAELSPAVVPATADRRGTSIFLEILDDAEDQRGRMITSKSFSEKDPFGTSPRPRPHPAMPLHRHK